MQDVIPSLRKLTPQEDMFALAVVEYSGNIGRAYLEAVDSNEKAPSARGFRLISDPAIAARILDLRNIQHDCLALSLEAHLVELAEIRDLAKALKQVKVALDAERSRGEVSGLYQQSSANRDLENLAQVARAAARAAYATTES